MNAIHTAIIQAYASTPRKQRNESFCRKLSLKQQAVFKKYENLFLGRPLFHVIEYLKAGLPSCKRCKKPCTGVSSYKPFTFSAYCGRDCANRDRTSTKHLKEKEYKASIVGKYRGKINKDQAIKSWSESNTKVFKKVFDKLSLSKDQPYETDILLALEETRKLKTLQLFINLPGSFNTRKELALSGTKAILTCKCGKLFIRKGKKNFCSKECSWGDSATDQKRITTNLKKFGKENVMQTRKGRNKHFSTCVKTKVVYLGSRTVEVQGFEPKVLDYLQTDIGIKPDILRVEKEIPIITYADETGKQRRYFPDLGIPKLNLLIEVKSTYTLLKTENIFERNKAKARACVEQGFNYLLYIADTKPKRLPRNWLTLSFSEMKKYLGKQS